LSEFKNMLSNLSGLKKENNKLCNEHDEYVKTNDTLVKLLNKTRDKLSKLADNITAIKHKFSKHKRLMVLCKLLRLQH
jgi:DNA gyrase/topoisomerase IV subunit A